MNDFPAPPVSALANDPYSLRRWLLRFAFLASCGLLMLSGVSCGPFGCFPPDPDNIEAIGLDVRCLAMQPDGKILIGGSFSSIRGVARNNIARLERDGSLDVSFDPNVSEGSGVYGIVVQFDGKIVLGGNFTKVGGVSRQHLARVNADGSMDMGFDPHSGGSVYCMAAQVDGKLLVGGDFSSIGGAVRKNIARIEDSGAADPTFLVDAPDHSLISLAVQPNGEVIFGGFFMAVGSVPRHHLARVSPTGVLDATFDPDVTGASLASSLVVQPDGKILVGGSFTAVGGLVRENLARLNANGTLDTVSGFDPRPNAMVTGLSLQCDGSVVVTGDFTTLDRLGLGSPTSRSRIARVTNGGLVDDLIQDADGLAYGACHQADGQVLVVGEFNAIGASSRQHFARFAGGVATQELSNLSCRRVQWLRGGASPEAQMRSFTVQRYRKMARCCWVGLSRPFSQMGRPHPG